MAMHTELEIHKSAEELLGIVLNLVRNIPRDLKQVVGAKLRDECLLGQATASHHERAQIARLLLRRGYTVNAALTQTYRKRGAP